MSDMPSMRSAYDFRRHRLYRGSSRRHASRSDVAYWTAVIALTVIDVALIVYLLCASGLIWWIV